MKLAFGVLALGLFLNSFSQVYASENKTPLLKPFLTDGCTHFFEGSLSNPTLWQHCCVLHDFKYWMGGSEEDRYYADVDQRACVEDSGAPMIAGLMFAANQSFGRSYWGQGWLYRRDDAPLSAEENTAVALLRPKDPLDVPVVHGSSDNKTLPELTMDACRDRAIKTLAHHMPPRFLKIVSRNQEHIAYRFVIDDECGGSRVDVHFDLDPALCVRQPWMEHHELIQSVPMDVRPVDGCS